MLIFIRINEWNIGFVNNDLYPLSNIMILRRLFGHLFLSQSHQTLTGDAAGRHRHAVRKQIVENGQIVHRRGAHNEHMPDGVRKRNGAVRLEEEYANQIDQSAHFQLVHAAELVTTADDHQRRTDAHHDVQHRLQAFVAFVVHLQKLRFKHHDGITHMNLLQTNLLVEYAERGQQPGGPFQTEQQGVRVNRCAEAEPRKV